MLVLFRCSIHVIASARSKSVFVLFARGATSCGHSATAPARKSNSSRVLQQSELLWFLPTTFTVSMKTRPAHGC